MQPLLKELLALLIALPLLLSVGSATAQPSDIRVVIEEGNQQWSAAFSQGDSAAIAAMYTLNAQLFPMHREIVSGMEAIQQFWQGVIASGVKGATLTTLEVDEQGDTAYEVGKYELRGEGHKVLIMGNTSLSGNASKGNGDCTAIFGIALCQRPNSNCSFA
jgi:ketosteroid isomerase-like protein